MLPVDWAAEVLSDQGRVMRAPRKPQTTAGFLAQHARQRPDSVAIEAVDGRTLYHDLAQMVLRARDLLIGVGIERGHVLGVLIPDRRSHLVVLLAAETLGDHHLLPDRVRGWGADPSGCPVRLASDVGTGRGGHQ